MAQKTATSRFRPSASEARSRNRRAGFTLIELAVALTIVLMIVSMVVPTVAKMLASRASMEAFNLVAAQLSAARAEAIANDTYAGIHVQLDTEAQMADKTAYSMIIIYDETNAVFRNYFKPRGQTDNLYFMPQELPGHTALGKLTRDFVTDADPGQYYNLGDNELETFCAFSVIFSPDGAVVTHVKGGNVMFDINDAMFSGSNTTLWDHTLANDKPGVIAFTMFDYLELLKRESDARITYLDEHGQFLPVNMHTGQLFDRR